MFILMYYWLLNLPLIDLYTHGTKFQVRLYYSDRVSDRNLYHDCLLYNGAYPYPQYESDGATMNRPYQIIPYCIRGLDADDNITIFDQYSVIPGIPIAFQTLMDENVTSEMLYLSSIPIDVVEQYQAFLENPRKASSNQKLYNCSIPWFGEFCQYSLTSIEPFQEIVMNYFHALASPPKGLDPSNYITCYTFIKCDRGPWPSCLDWREICDGKIDCQNGGVDEIGCDDLDTNECNDDEYRCANSFCIPSDFFNDDTHNPDCMDASDEKQDYALYDYSVKCHFDPTFRCEERSCRDQRQDACGDGQCGRGRCENARDTTLSQAKLPWDANLHLSFDCWVSLICLIIPPYSRLPVLNLTTECPTWEQSKSIGTAHCPEHFFFPAQPIALGHVRLLYDRNATFQINFDYHLPLPYYVCYNQHLCESIRPTIRLNESSCLLFSEIDQVGSETTWNLMKNRVVDFFARCLLTEKTYVVCPNSKPFRCANSSKCLTLNRLMDGVVDCIEEDDEQMAHSCLLPDKRFRFKCLSDDVCKDIRSIDYRDHMCKIFDNGQVNEVLLKVIPT